METRTLTLERADIGTLAYSERTGEKLPIVFVHGSGFSKDVFKLQFESRQLSGHHLFAIDLPGHGDSADANDPSAVYSYAGLASVVTDFIERLNIDRCLLVGWSLGGHVAYDMLDTVPQVAGVMAFGAPPAVGGPLGIIRSLHISKNLLLISKAKFTRADAERFERVCLDGHFAGEFVETLCRTDEKMRPCLSRSVMASTGQGQKKRVESARTPICLLQGRHDPVSRTGYMQAFPGQNLFAGRCIIFDESGHAPFVDAADKFDCLLAQFADFAEAGGSAAGGTLPETYALAG